MGGVCRMHGEDEKAYRFWLKSLKGRDHLEYLGVDGRIKLK
jgi:hypothetical protein